MRILPAIDLLDGKAVRLHQGRYEEATVYDADPPAVARRLRGKIDLLHVVDLEGAKAGEPVQRDRVREIAEAFGGALQVGGGVRSRAALEGYLALGAKRVVLGTAAVKDPELVRELARAYPGVVVLAVDAKNGYVATDGWTVTSQITAVDLVRSLGDVPIGAVLYTDVARDGTGSGPNVEATGALAKSSPFPVIASGGVGTAAHLTALAALPNVESAIVGRALYDGSLTLDDAIAAATAH
ncbi:Phosphoribosylformimino-5-aminoimidazole carboxamide ribotide isomerase [Labilithrix luteola]|uniref:1-(5-phosphoribosyl)-5-[(5-phosphoribosylamino)methylideneamino] imidazole-4-carboxamide isomerase n=1 Tax=Labilithrix luteola TaxID=1391654 RepID=A0A0K1Q803_9BACT|nr:1-(5-phosphoribosyl)-5-[(5-phosphoribosylamino)methylideneamino]imidazole-4-carboxamide isomerase [Labilithrix luteola]AKV01540.1 Phosphoribosylformimino-5-aminoimidazole carboxamide ribotide isomerase [Labilithrix luteola]